MDLGTYERQRDRLREEQTLVEIDRHGSNVEEFDVERPELCGAGATPGVGSLDTGVVGATAASSTTVLSEGVTFGGKAFDQPS